MKKKKWISISLDKVDPLLLSNIFSLYKLSYQEIGATFKEMNELKKYYKMLMYIDIDSDPQPDAFIIYRKMKFGKKISLLGSDGNKESKKVLLSKYTGLLKSKMNWFGEASNKVAKINIQSNVPIVNDEKLVKSIIHPYEIKWIGENGKYQRKIAGSNETHTEQLFGHPKIIK